METNLMSRVDRLSDRQLCAELKRQASSELRLTASVIAHLAGFQERRLYLGEGYSSAFAYFTEVLGFSEDAAYNRTMVAKLVRKFPVILERLARGEVNLTSLRLLGPYLTPENHRGLLKAARGKRKMQVLELIASVAPKPPVSTSVRKLPARGSSDTSTSTPTSPTSTAASDASSPGATTSGDLPIFSNACEDAGAASTGWDVGAASAGGNAGVASSSGNGGAPSSSGNVAGASGSGDARTASAGGNAGPASDGGNGPGTSKLSTAKRPVITPLAPGLYKFEFTGKPGSYEKLSQLQELLRHQIPDGDPAEIIDRALGLLLRETKKKQLGITDRPRTSQGVAPGSPEIPAAVKRVVWKRDKGSCAFAAPNGHRCGAKGLVQFHHVDPHGVGGPPTIDNVELRCCPHNLYEAEQFFGPMKPPKRKNSAAGKSPARGKDTARGESTARRKDSVVRESPAPYGDVQICEWGRASRGSFDLQIWQENLLFRNG